MARTEASGQEEPTTDWWLSFQELSPLNSCESSYWQIVFVRLPEKACRLWGPGLLRIHSFAKWQGIGGVLDGSGSSGLGFQAESFNRPRGLPRGPAGENCSHGALANCHRWLE